MMKLGVAALFLLLPARALADDVTLIQPAGGFLVADGISQIPLELIIHAGSLAPAVESAAIRCATGKSDRILVAAPDRVLFDYAPVRGAAYEEELTIDLELAGGVTRTERISFKVAAPEKPELRFAVGPETFDARDPQPIEVRASSSGQNVEIHLASDRGNLVLDPTLERAELSARLQPPELPPDAPSHLVLMAVAASSFGYSARVSGSSAHATMRLSFELPAGEKLLVEGAENKLKPSRSKKGRATLDGVQVRYGAPIRVFSIKKGNRRELPFSVPAGLVSSGAVALIPGQNYADGGTGATLLIAVPPSPFGEEPMWPEITIRGAVLVNELQIAPDLRALVLRRPTTPSEVAVILDGEEVAKIPLLAPRPRRIDATEVPPGPGERAALKLTLAGASGEASDVSTPRARLADGRVLGVERLAAGVYRVGLPAGIDGTAEIIAATDGPIILAGRVLPKLEIRRKFGARAIAPLATIAQRVEPTRPTSFILDEPPARAKATPKVIDGDDGPRFGFLAKSLIGTTFGSPLMLLGGGAMAEIRILDRTLALRSGFELVRSSEPGVVTLNGTQPVTSQLTIFGAYVPLELGVIVYRADSFEVGIYGGGVLRVVESGLNVGGDDAGGNTHVAFAGRGAVETTLNLGSFGLVFGFTIDGIGSSMNELSTPQLQLEGTTLNFRGDAGLRWWL